MPPDQASDASNNVVFSRELYNLILRGATIPVLIFLIWLSWIIINRRMSPEWRQKRRNREIRQAVAAREARLAEAAREKATADEAKRPRF
jgi:hypothetical protein